MNDKSILNVVLVLGENDTRTRRRGFEYEYRRGAAEYEYEYKNVARLAIGQRKMWVMTGVLRCRLLLRHVGCCWRGDLGVTKEHFVPRLVTPADLL